jgi:type II secretory pathway component GspD/PulD (secretin)
MNNIRNRLIILFIFIFSILMLGNFYIWSSDDYIDLLFPDVRPTGYVTMNFKDVPLKVVLKVFSGQTGLNIIASQEIEERNITLYLDNVPADEAFNNILKAYNLTYEQEKDGNVAIVKEAIRTITRIYYLKFARVSTSVLGAEIGRGGGGAAASGLADAVRNSLSSEGKLIEDARTNSIMVTDIPSRFPLIEEAIKNLDVATPMVMVEVEMLDTSKEVLDKLGAKFGGRIFSITPGSFTTHWPFPERFFESGTTKTAFSMGTLNASSFTLILEFLNTDSDTKYLARPRLLTLNNETAEIKITTDEAIGKKTTSSGEGGAASTTEEAERTETGVSLRVTPQANVETGEITMFIEPSVKEAKTSDITIGTQTIKDPETRESHSTVRIKDGETVVVAGLIRSKNSDAKNKVPWLADIPILGSAFRHRENSTKDRELVVFITPHIIKDEKAGVSVTKASGVLKKIFEREQDVSSFRREEVETTLDTYDKIK